MRIPPLALCAALFCLPALAAEGPDRPARPDQLQDYLFPPDLLLRHADELKLDDAQKQFIEAESRKFRERVPELQQALQNQTAALGELIREAQPDEQKALAQLDKVLDAEREIKRAQLAMVLSIRAKLTPEQQAKAREARDKMMAEMRNRKPVPESLRAKIQEAQDLARKAQAQGRDMSDFRPLMEELQGLMRDGKYDEAQALLDRGIKKLKDEK